MLCRDMTSAVSAHLTALHNLHQICKYLQSELSEALWT